MEIIAEVREATAHQRRVCVDALHKSTFILLSISEELYLLASCLYLMHNSHFCRAQLCQSATQPQAAPLSYRPSVCLSICLFVCLFVCMSVRPITAGQPRDSSLLDADLRTQGRRGTPSVRASNETSVGKTATNGDFRLINRYNSETIENGYVVTWQAIGIGTNFDIFK